MVDTVELSIDQCRLRIGKVKTHIDDILSERKTSIAKEDLAAAKSFFGKAERYLKDSSDSVTNIYRGDDIAAYEEIKEALLKINKEHEKNIGLIVRRIIELNNNVVNNQVTFDPEGYLMLSEVYEAIKTPR